MTPQPNAMRPNHNEGLKVNQRSMVQLAGTSNFGQKKFRRESDAPTKQDVCDKEDREDNIVLRVGHVKILAQALSDH